jgi:hypothetical protein
MSFLAHKAGDRLLQVLPRYEETLQGGKQASDLKHASWSGLIVTLPASVKALEAAPAAVRYKICSPAGGARIATATNSLGDAVAAFAAMWPPA